MGDTAMRLNDSNIEQSNLNLNLFGGRGSGVIAESDKVANSTATGSACVINDQLKAMIEKSLLEPTNNDINITGSGSFVVEKSASIASKSASSNPIGKDKFRSTTGVGSTDPILTVGVSRQ